jgi:tetratricopeptide (TPR) repeat protein/transcriptional regulator with XRE-family HTH domain
MPAGGGVFGQLVIRYRRRSGLTQEELADRSGVSVRTIRDLETGRRRLPRPGSVRLLAEAFELEGTEREQFQRQASGVDEPAPALARTGGPVPAQLPADVHPFIGRAAELRALATRLAGRDGSGLYVLSGTAGVGKTALAVHWGHLVRDEFPDGQFYVDLRGYGPGQAMQPGEALSRFLSALGVPGPEIALDVDERATQFRTRLAGRRVLIVLDNAATVEQVRPLLPGAGRYLVVVTSRDSLAGLVARDGAYRVELGLLAVDDARGLLRQLVGDRVDAQPSAAAELAAQCARLPLALRVAAELAVSRPDATLDELVADLADESVRLDLLNAGGDPQSAVTAVFSWSVRHLDPATARTFRLVGLHPGPDYDAYAVAALADCDLSAARHRLRLLTQAHLVYAVGAERFGQHDLLRAYAAQLADATDGDDARAALDRLFAQGQATASAAMDSLYPAEVDRRPRAPRWPGPAPDLTDRAAALSWLDVHRAALVTAVAHASGHGRPAAAVELARTLFRYLVAGHFTDAVTVWEHAHAAARAAGDRAGEAEALFALGTVHGRRGRYELARDHLERALRLWQEVGDRVGQGRALGNLGAAEQRIGRLPVAAGYHARALVLFDAAGDRIGAARARNNLGEIARRLGRYEEAGEHGRGALAIYREIGDGAGEAAALLNLAELDNHQGDHASALDNLARARAIYRQHGHRSGEAWTLHSLGTAHNGLDRPRDAITHHRQALRLFRLIGERDGEAWALNGLGEAAFRLGRHAEACAHHAAALAVASGIDSRDQEARAHAGLGQAHQAMDRCATAQEHWQEALRRYTDLADPQADRVRAELAALVAARPAPHRRRVRAAAPG